jgi:hypothetical protein
MSARAPDSKKNFIAILSKATERRSVEAPPQKSQAISDRLVGRLLVGFMTSLRRRAAKAG